MSTPAADGPTAPILPSGAVHYASDSAKSTVLAAFAISVAARGWRVAGMMIDTL